MTTILSSGYSIHIGNKTLHLLKDALVSTQISKDQAFILVDENTKRDCLPLFLQEIPTLKEASIIEIKSGEANKNIDTCIKIWNFLSQKNATRKALLINLGGGVIGDMGGFAASTYKRGIDFIQVPTTLLSQVDSSVGGKLGIDLENLKNQVGVFNNPRAVYIYPEFLKTLPEDQLISGYAEALKHALIKDSEYWKKIKKADFKNFNAYTEIITHSVNIKNKIVQEDPKEKGARKLLNFGHTIGHAVESWFLTNKEVPLLHGHAIAIGMVCEGFLSFQKGLISSTVLNEIMETLFKYYPKPSIEEHSYPSLLSLMKNDKKNDSSEYNFTLIKKIGEGVFNKNCEEQEIIESFQFYNQSIN